MIETQVVMNFMIQYCTLNVTFYLLYVYMV